MTALVENQLNLYCVDQCCPKCVGLIFQRPTFCVEQKCFQEIMVELKKVKCMRILNLAFFLSLSRIKKKSLSVISSSLFKKRSYKYLLRITTFRSRLSS